MSKKQNKRFVFSNKINRLRKGNRPRTLDLFAGCGGISLGFQRAGFDIAAAMEIDPHAARTHADNFHSCLDSAGYELHALLRDITQIEPAELVQELHLGETVENSIDVIVGGPPCQAFARVGRAKLREVAEHPEAFLNDPRSNLYLRYLHYIRELKPITLVMENVPDVLNFGGHNVAEEVCETLDEMGYVCNYTLLNSVYYGVPEMRERAFVVAYAKELEQNVSFPEPTHWVDLPRGYHGSRQVALKHVSRGDGLNQSNSHYVDPPLPTTDLSPAVTAKAALADLPKLSDHLEGKLDRGARRFTKLMPYPKRTKLNAYAELMRHWPQFENTDGIYDHLIRSLPRDYQIFARMNAGDQYPEAHQHAIDIFSEELARQRASGARIADNSMEHESLRKSIVPPYDPGKFPNKWRKMEPDKPARTLMAHLGKDSYSHIHYDSAQARTISIREAARLQSFPDGFKFSGTMNPAFKQIGNAVPPLMAFALAEEIMKTLQHSMKKAMVA